tara:strand:+ start:160 stop:432 length:273 start_codon:yes stop_codon:yes gene_type:complete
MANKIKRIYIYRDSHLPEEGWLQSCFKCAEITGKYILFKTFYKNKELYEFYIHTCNKCKGIFERNPIEYIYYSDDCNYYIKVKFSELFTG